MLKYNDMKIDYEQLEQQLKKMQPRQKLYELVKNEMISRGRWKIASRGIAFKPGYDERRSDSRVGTKS
jgi:hypothetical protein